MLPGQLEEAEAELERLQEQTAAPGFYEQDHAVVSDVLAQLQQQEQQVEDLMERWVELEAMQE